MKKKFLFYHMTLLFCGFPVGFIHIWGKYTEKTTCSIVT